MKYIYKTLNIGFNKAEFTQLKKFKRNHRYISWKELFLDLTKEKKTQDTIQDTTSVKYV